MNVLFITYDFPFPTNSGGKTRAFNLLKQAAGKTSIHLFSFTRDGFDLSTISEMKKIGVKSVELFPRRSVKNLGNLKAFIHPNHSIFYYLYYEKHITDSIIEFIATHKIDIVHAESFYTGFYLEFLRDNGVKLVYGSENIESRLYKEFAEASNMFTRQVYSSQVKRIAKEEEKMAAISDLTVAVTEEEKKHFASFAPSTAVVPNGVSLNAFPLKDPTIGRSNKLLFIGNFSYFPNRDGLRFFIRDVYPRLAKDIELIVIGKNAEKLNFLPKQNLRIIPYIQDIYDAYAMGDIFISPIRFGGGTNFKVIEAMAAGVPVVALKDKSSGLEAADGKEIFVASNADEFVKSITSLMANPNLRETLAKNARKLVKEKYEWTNVGKKLVEAWEQIL